MKRILILIGALLAFPQPALATPIFHWITESDPGGPNNVIVTSFDSLADVANLNVASSSPIFNFPGAISISGLTSVSDPLQVPEPATAALFAGALAGLLVLRRHKGRA